LNASSPLLDRSLSAKAALRAEMRLRRANLDAPTRAAASLALRDRFLADIALPPNATVAGYAAFGDEIDPLPLMAALHARGYAMALPVVVAKGAALVFRAYAPGDALVQHRFGMSEPAAERATRVPSFVLVPLLAFDATGRRLGYGGGFYDRTLAALRPTQTIGLGFSCQRIDTVPADDHDQKLDCIATEDAIWKVSQPC
jgi:5-formyltetrahydrofolate cyclo-ligase